MTAKEIIEEVSTDVTDIIQTEFEYVNTNLVPNRSDAQLTFERNVTKRGKILNTCVLYVDIRNSVQLTRTHRADAMGKIYTAFAKVVLKIAKSYNGHIRNIIGDRVMVVFPMANCFVNAVDCAISINHAMKNVINAKFAGVDFKCGIGIDFGELKVIKVGVQRRGNEAAENRSLVWVGYPANIASRLTDVAAKSIQETYYEIVRNPINPFAVSPLKGLAGALGLPNAASTPFYLAKEETVIMTPQEFADKVFSSSRGQLDLLGGKFIRFDKKTRNIKYAEILITEAVFNGLKAAVPERDYIKNGYWKTQDHPIANVNSKVLGADLTWVIS